MKIVLRYSVVLLSVLTVSISVKGLVKHTIVSSENEVECEADKITFTGDQLSFQNKFTPFFQVKAYPYGFLSFLFPKVTVPSLFAEKTPLFIRHCSWLL